MYALFLETHACKQIDAYVDDNGGDGEAIKKRAYEECISQQKDYDRGETAEEFDNWWVDRCFNSNSHKDFVIDSLFTWRESKEGHDYWERISLYLELEW